MEAKANVLVRSFDGKVVHLFEGVEIEVEDFYLDQQGNTRIPRYGRLSFDAADFNQLEEIREIEYCVEGTEVRVFLAVHRCNVSNTSASNMVTFLVYPQGEKLA